MAKTTSNQELAKALLEATGTYEEARAELRNARKFVTVLIHGTCSSGDPWYQEHGRFHRYIENVVFPGDDVRPFRWSGGNTHTDRVQAANRLYDEFRGVGEEGRLRIIGHSHGANVANLATQASAERPNGLQACTLIHLSVPVLPEYLPNMSNIGSNKFYTIYASVDLVVASTGGDQNYQNTEVGGFEEYRVIAPVGHWASLSIARWELRNIPDFVQSVCW